jgi:pimeloyl-ACP methyl ester carboxylesterase
MVSFLQSTSFAATETDQALAKSFSEPTVVTIQNEESYMYLGGTNGVFLCFHGRGGNATGWTKDEKKEYLDYFKNLGFSFICPSSISKTWQSSDVKRVNSLLDKIGIPKNKKIWLVGHSNGGAFASRYALTSKRNIQAVHLANSRGIGKILRRKNWRFPTFFSYSRCDKIVEYRNIEKNYIRVGAPKAAVILDYLYHSREDQTCHTFINVAERFSSFQRNH